MMRLPTVLALTTALALAAGCKKDDAAAPADTAAGVPTATAPATAPLPDASPATAPLGSAQATVSAVDLGNAVGADNRVTAVTTTFAPTDTIYASVTTTGASASVPVTAKWTYQDGQVVGTETRTLDAGGPSTIEFHASKPGGWPAGTYKVEVSVGGNVVQTKEFTVR